MSETTPGDRQTFKRFRDVFDALTGVAPDATALVATIADGIVCEAVTEYGNIDAATARISAKVPGAGWMYVGCDDSSRTIRCGFFAVDHPQFDAFRPALQALDGKRWAGPGDLGEDLTLHAVRLDAVLAQDDPDEIAGRYEGLFDEVDEALESEIEAWHAALPLQSGIPEEVIGFTRVLRFP